MYSSCTNPTKHHQELMEKIQVNQYLKYMSKTNLVTTELLPLEDFSSFVAQFCK